MCTTIGSVTSKDTELQIVEQLLPNSECIITKMEDYYGTNEPSEWKYIRYVEIVYELKSNAFVLFYQSDCYRGNSETTMLQIFPTIATFEIYWYVCLKTFKNGTYSLKEYTLNQNKFHYERSHPLIQNLRKFRLGEIMSLIDNTKKSKLN